MENIVVLDGEISLQNHMDGEWDLNIPADGDPNVIIIEGGGQSYPHYQGDYTVEPSLTAQVLDTDGKVMDNDVTVQAVQAGSATTPATIITANPTLSRSGRVVTATVSKTQSVTPTVVEGYVSSGTAGNIGVSGSDTLTIPEGSATTPATSVTANPSISVSSAGVITATVSKSESVTPTVVEGYVSSGTAGTVSVSGSATENLTTQGAQTIHPASTDQSIASGKYLTGAQTIKGVTVTGLTADKVLQGTTVEIGDSDDSDRIMKVVGTAQQGITPTGTKQITQNGTNIDVYSYQYADVAVPNSYSAGDEGKVVSNGALVSQTSDTVTANDTYDTTLINSLTVNVSGGGSIQTASGTVTGSGNATQTVVCSFEPDVVKIYRSDIASIVAVADRCLASLYISKQGAYSCLYTNANATNTSNGGHGIFEGMSSWTTGLNVNNTVYARYENGTITIGPGNGQRYSSALTYKYEFIKY